MNGRRALVIVPTYNERTNIPTLIDKLLENEGVRVLVVDDQSPDGTGAVRAVGRASATRTARFTEGGCRS